MQPEQFAGASPAFRLEQYFLGHTRAWGIVEDRFGTVRKQFVVEMAGRQDGETFILDERFHYADGTSDHRVWQIRRRDGNTYEGTAADVVGTARGRAFGNALNWRYRFDLPVGGRRWRVRFDDWMFLQPGGIVINRAKMRKWGFRIGELTLAFAKPGALPAAGQQPAGEREEQRVGEAAQQL